MHCAAREQFGPGSQNEASVGKDSLAPVTAVSARNRQRRRSVQLIVRGFLIALGELIVRPIAERGCARVLAAAKHGFAILLRSEAKRHERTDASMREPSQYGCLALRPQVHAEVIPPSFELDEKGFLLGDDRVRHVTSSNNYQ